MRSLADLLRVVPAALALALTLSGCEAEESSDELPIPLAEVESLSERPCPDDSILTYENFGEGFFLTWCSGCHSAALPEGERQQAPLDSTYDSLEEIREGAARIWRRAGDHNRTMPPLAGPDDEEHERLGEWLACGAPSERD
jgi:hypothetical protein